MDSSLLEAGHPHQTPLGRILGRVPTSPPSANIPVDPILSGGNSTNASTDPTPVGATATTNAVAGIGADSFFRCSSISSEVVSSYLSSSELPNRSDDGAAGMEGTAANNEGELKRRRTAKKQRALGRMIAHLQKENGALKDTVKRQAAAAHTYSIAANSRQSSLAASFAAVGGAADGAHHSRSTPPAPALVMSPEEAAVATALAPYLLSGDVSNKTSINTNNGAGNSINKNSNSAANAVKMMGMSGSGLGTVSAMRRSSSPSTPRNQQQRSSTTAAAGVGCVDASTTSMIRSIADPALLQALLMRAVGKQQALERVLQHQISERRSLLVHSVRLREDRDGLRGEVEVLTTRLDEMAELLARSQAEAAAALATAKASGSSVVPAVVANATPPTSHLPGDPVSTSNGAGGGDGNDGDEDGLAMTATSSVQQLLHRSPRSSSPGPAPPLAPTPAVVSAPSPNASGLRKVSPARGPVTAVKPLTQVAGRTSTPASGGVGFRRATGAGATTTSASPTGGTVMSRASPTPRQRQMGTATTAAAGSAATPTSASATPAAGRLGTPTVTSLSTSTVANRNRTPLRAGQPTAAGGVQRSAAASGGGLGASRAGASSAHNTSSCGSGTGPIAGSTSTPAATSRLGATTTPVRSTTPLQQRSGGLAAGKPTGLAAASGSAPKRTTTTSTAAPNGTRAALTSSPYRPLTGTARTGVAVPTSSAAATPARATTASTPTSRPLPPATATAVSALRRPSPVAGSGGSRVTPPPTVASSSGNAGSSMRNALGVTPTKSRLLTPDRRKTSSFTPNATSPSSSPSAGSKPSTSATAAPTVSAAGVEAAAPPADGAAADGTEPTPAEDVAVAVE